MSSAAAKTAPPAGQTLVLDNVNWRTYSSLLHTFAERPCIRLTYDRGRLEIMAPLLAHDDEADFFGDLVKALAEAYGLPVKRGGSVTIRLRKAQRGIEPDRCFWLANAERMAGVRHLDLRTHPPPDLAIEVDVTHSSMDRMGIYATLEVPELWHLDGDELTFHVLDEKGEYARVDQSRSFPGVKPADLLPFLKDARAAGDETPLLRRFRAWAARQAKRHKRRRP
jgi:Uma2 family endonuclease